AKSVISTIDIPSERNAAMDGYAFSSKDIAENQPFTLQLVGTSWAGKPFADRPDQRQCVRIFTGAVVPDFADSVITQEQVTVDGKNITLPGNTQPFKNIRAAGSDVKKQDILLTAGKQLTARDLALLAAAGVEKVDVYRRIKIGYFSTGDELVALGQTLQPGQIYDSNRYLLAGLLSDPSLSVTDLGIVEDDPERLEQTVIRAAKTFDMLISTGGASVGEADYVEQILKKCGQINFWKLAIKPGKPLAFGKIDNCWFFGLPGNPIAVLVTFEQFVKPALRRLAGGVTSTAIRLRARCENPLSKSPGRQEYQRGILTQIAPGEYSVMSAGRQDSHQLKVASQANCLIILDSECAGVEAGEFVTVEPFENRI
ncbi:MAG: molybdopterin molybdotransferase MoeA, partial [Methylomonas sp.]|nr:molybdopterin molybdotransferase MoeA [Methylomonas sp.]